ncbi:MAG: hypothetical protein RL757_915 [Bacteroidota bacterium]|jgi:hypothetical protein
MKKIFSLLAACLLMGSVVLFEQCKCDKCEDPANPECSNYDPCYGVAKTSADFKIEERTGSYWVETDTVDRYSSIRFTAIQDGESYRWLIGADEYNEKSFSLTSFPHDTWVGVTLIIQRTPNKNCHPNDRGIDTVYRRFYVWPPWVGPDPTGRFIMIQNPYPIHGSYYGGLKSNPSNKFEVTVKDSNEITRGASYRVDIVGVMAGIPSPDYDSRKIGHFFSSGAFADDDTPTAMSIRCDGYGGGSSGFTETPKMEGLAWLNDKDSRFITIAYRSRYANSTTWSPMDTFVGQKIR